MAELSEVKELFADMFIDYFDAKIRGFVKIKSASKKKAMGYVCQHCGLFCGKGSKERLHSVHLGKRGRLEVIKKYVDKMEVGADGRIRIDPDHHLPLVCQVVLEAVIGFLCEAHHKKYEAGMLPGWKPTGNPFVAKNISCG